MQHIIIKKIGPVDFVDIDLSRITVFIGPQSSGKSTIAKIISFCSWYEKQTILTTKLPRDFYTELISFHNLEEGYFSEDSLIDYSSKWSHIVFHGSGNEPAKVTVDISSDNIFRNKKIQYIPSERNFVTISGIGRYNETRDNVLGFLYDWFEAKREQKKDKLFEFPLSSLGNTFYYYNEKDDLDVIVFDENKQISLRHASSGLMSVTPLLVVFKYIVDTIYSKDRIQSPFEIINIQSKLSLLKDDQRRAFAELIQQVLDTQKSLDAYDGDKEVFQRRLIDIQKNMSRAIGFDTDYEASQVIIEEPELNLFPSTQRELIYYFLNRINNPEREHQLILTTHSPYILFALNNCLLGGLIKDKIPKEQFTTFQSCNSWIHPENVKIYEIHNGKLESPQDDDGILKNNYLNKAYQENSKEYMSLLNYYEPDTFE